MIISGIWVPSSVKIDMDDAKFKDTNDLWSYEILYDASK